MEILKKNFRRVLMLTGILIFALSISVFAVEADVARINSGDTFTTLKEAYEKAADEDTITLLCDTSGDGIVIKKSITIDFDGYTYTFAGSGVGSSGTETNGFQILKGNTVTLKNGKLDVAESHEENFAILIQNYANLNIVSMTLDGKNLDRTIIKKANGEIGSSLSYVL